jgi:hypothetical protein
LKWKVEMDRRSVEVERGGREEIEGRIRQRRGVKKREGMYRLIGKGTGD